ncbi:26s proteasome non-atpase regulatory subunit 9 [Trichoderma arundinaceum]|uniref:26s proteasome non-atpase regulatory subunit 9 n=1 Tax=Trichoderma arundinaceum TaxID=490622 RepID=A0A395NK10_TRIAR|nr:26s proteasome non-atpase regulatory subunit 9 [Trichoderma arundinaceum]
MDTLHAPTVPSGPTSTFSQRNGVSGNQSFAELQRKKDDLEAELKALGSVLDSHGVDMQTPLLTRDGFPRADLDIAQIRTTRARIIRLRNDYKDLMTVIEKHLHEHFANIQDGDEAPVVAGDEPRILPDSQLEQLDEPFAKVNSVAAGSPAQQAGLQAGDEIRNFGYVNRSNHDGLKKVAECVQGNEGSFNREMSSSKYLDRTELLADRSCG